MLYALHTLRAPGALVAGYQRGDEIHEAVAESWGLTEEDVSTERPGSEPKAVVTPRPDEGANRAAWEGWALANGMSEEDVAAATQDDLEAFEPDGTTDSNRPADSAKKAEWVRYVQGRTDDEGVKSWAGADTTTKADLQGWTPETRVGDPVAVAATDQANG